MKNKEKCCICNGNGEIQVLNKEFNIEVFNIKKCPLCDEKGFLLLNSAENDSK